MPSLMLRTRAAAKINLTLHVVGRRADGYHDLESLVVFAGVHDVLSFVPRAAGSDPDFSLRVTGPRAEGCGPAQDNLVLKAASILQSLQPGMRTGHFHLLKRLPAQAGIGGGSADAAAALRLMAQASQLPLHDPAVLAAAVATGADVPVCLLARAQMVRGLGEALEPVEGLQTCFAVLVNPGAKIETRAAFARFGLKPGDRRDNSAHPALDVTSMQRMLAAGRNDFQPLATETAPDVALALQSLMAQPECWLARMSGSGSTCFGLFADCHAAARAARAIRHKHPGWWVVPTALR